MNTEKPTPGRVVIVGGGLAGLTAAAMLSRHGAAVTVIEKSSRLGGRAMTTVEQGFHLNLGPHAWYAGSRATAIMRDLGVAIAGRIPAPAGAYAVTRRRMHALPIGLLSLLTTDLLPLRGKLQLARTLASLPRLDASALDGTTLTDWLDRTVSDPAARSVLLATIRTTTYVDAPELLSAGAALAQLRLALEGNVWYLDGGWQSVVDALADAAWSKGARLLTGVHVTGAVIESGMVRGVRLGTGEVLAAEHVVVATPPDAARELGIAVPDTVAVKAACLDLGLARAPRPSVRFAVGIDRPLYYSVHSATAALAPEGRTLIHVAKYLNPTGPADPRRDRNELESFMDHLQPGWRTEIVTERFLPAMTVTYALPAAESGGVRGRPPVSVDGVAGLYLAGDWVGAEGQLANAAVVSGAAAAGLIGSAARARPAA